MVVEHHTIPLAASHHFIVIIGEPLVLRHEMTDGNTITNSSRIVDMRHAGTSYRRVIDQLIESVLSLNGNLRFQRLAA